MNSRRHLIVKLAPLVSHIWETLQRASHFTFSTSIVNSHDSFFFSLFIRKIHNANPPSFTFPFPGNVSVEEGTDGDFSAVTVYVRFSRRYEFYLLTLYIPTTLLILIAYSTFYFNPVIFQPRIIVAITALLVLSSLFTQVGLVMVREAALPFVSAGERVTGSGCL